MKFHVSKLPAGPAHARPAEIFAPFGVIMPPLVMSAGVSGHCQGFGFLEMMRDSGERAISRLNGQESDGVALRINDARAKS